MRKSSGKSKEKRRRKKKKGVEKRRRKLIGTMTSCPIGRRQICDVAFAHNISGGGLGSNFLTGGAGRDVFFLDGRAAAQGAVTWSTITDRTAAPHSAGMRRPG